MSSSYFPKVYAHRGTNRLAPENCRPAFDLALIEGADGFETDIQFSKDSVPLLWHDDEMERIGMPNKAVSDYLWEELELLDCSLLCSEFQRFCGLLRLEEFVNLYYRKVPLLLELKEMNKMDRLTQEKNIKVFMNRLQAAAIDFHKVMISSFNHSLLAMVNSFTNVNFTVANIDEAEVSKDLNKLLADYPFLKGVCLEKSLVDENTITKAKDLGLTTLVYTCNTEEEIEAVLSCNVDIIISDIPGECRKIINKLLQIK